MSFLEAISSLPVGPLLLLFVALATAFAFEFINGFHDTANAVTTVIYSRSLPPLAAVIYSGFLNFLGVLLGGTAVAFSIVNLLPVDLLVDARSGAALVMVLSLLLAGVMWNLGTWYIGLPVSSSHTLIGSILGVGMANSLWVGQGLAGVNWQECLKVGLALLISPLLGFLLAGLFLLVLKATVRSPRLYQPPPDHDRPPGWIRTLLIGTWRLLEAVLRKTQPVMRRPMTKRMPASPIVAGSVNTHALRILITIWRWTPDRLATIVPATPLLRT